jgi:hypothetical protein
MLLRDGILDMCCKRDNDEWAEVLAGRIQNCNDLVVDKSVYRKKCQSDFHLGKPYRILTDVADSFPSTAIAAAHRPIDAKKSCIVYCAMSVVRKSD